MKNIIKLILMLIVASTSITATASRSDADAPTKKEWETIEHFATADECRMYNKEALECANYVVANSADENLKFWLCAQFLVHWCEASDEVLITLGQELCDSFIGSKELVTIYLAGCVKSALEDGQKKEFTKPLYVKAMTIVTDYYIKHKKEIDKTADKKLGMKDLVKMKEKGTLAGHLEKLYDTHYTANK